MPFPKSNSQPTQAPPLAPEKSKPHRSLFGVVFRHEARLLWRDKGVGLLLLLVVLWLSAAVFVGRAQQQRQNILGEKLHQADRDFIAKETKEFADDPEGNSWRLVAATSALRLTQRLVLPPGPLSALDVGQSDLRPSVYTLREKWEKFFLSDGPLRNETVLKTARFDVGFVAVYLLPLIVIALCFNLLAGEREKGTSLLVLSQPVSPRTLLMAALVLRFLVLSAVVLGSVLALLLLKGGVGSLVAWVRLILWGLTVMAYLAFWFALAALVVSLGAKASLNALMLLTAWIFLSIGVPGIVSLVAETRYPVPPRSDIIRAMNLTNDAVSANWRTNALPFRVFFKDYPELLSDTISLEGNEYHDTVIDEPPFPQRLATWNIRIATVQAYAVEKTALQAAAPHRAALDNQIALVRTSRLFSPVIATREGLMDISGSGDARYQHFEKEALGFWEKWRYKFLRYTFKHIPFTVEDYRNNEWFQYQEEDMRTVAARVLPGILSMLLLAMFLLGASLKFVSRQQSPLPNR